MTVNRRIFIEPHMVKDDILTISGDLHHYLKNVLRIKKEDTITAILTQDKKVFIAKPAAINDSEITASIIDNKDYTPEKHYTLSIIQALPKSKKMELIIQKGTELGADSFYILISKRCIPDISSKEKKRIDRYSTIAQEAAKQSRRLSIPSIEGPLSVDHLTQIYGEHDLNIVLWEHEKTRTLKQVLSSTTPASISVTIGPEGGFTEEEIIQMQNSGATAVSLGTSILRTETAGIAAVSMIRYEYEL